MNNYRNEILNEFIDRYEKSSYYKGKSEKNRKNYIKFKLHIFTYEYTRNYYHIIKI